MREPWIGAVVGLMAAAATLALSRLPWGWVAAGLLLGALGWLAGAYAGRQVKLARHDELTGLANRRPFELAFRREFGRAQRYGRPLSLLFLELDDFGQLNKRFGHLTGDEALKAVARLLRDGIRDTDLLCRWGGDEFAVLLPETDPAKALLLAERLRADLELTPVRDAGQSIRVTMSTGVAGMPGRARSPADLLRMAIEAQQQAKGEKNAVRVVS